jgi:carbon storage regulator
LNFIKAHLRTWEGLRMLVLARKKGQSIIINDNIEIMVIDVQKDVVRLGIKAPKEVSIYRREIYEEIEQENKMALQTRKISFKDLFGSKNTD